MESSCNADFDLKKYNLEKYLAEGTYGTVTKWKMNSTTQQVSLNPETHISIAIKTFKNANSLQIDCIREVSILRTLNHHANIIKVLGVASENDNYPQMIMELLDSSMKEYLKKNRNSTFKQIMHCYRMIKEGVTYLHKCGFMHRDLKPENILCANCDDVTKCVLKIADFGLAQRYIKGRLNTLNVQTLWYRAPEVLLKNPYYTVTIDLFSVGLCFLQLLNVDAHSFGKHTEAMQLQNWFALIGTDSIRTWNETSSSPLKSEFDTWQNHTRYTLDFLFEKRFSSQERKIMEDIIESLLYVHPNKRILKEFTTVEDEDAAEEWFSNFPLTTSQCDNRYSFMSHENARGTYHQKELYQKATHLHLNMRWFVYNWIIDSTCQFNLKMYTYISCIDIMDRFIEIKYENMKQDDLKIIAVSCLYIACGLYESNLFDIGYLAKLSGTNAPQITIIIKRIALCLDFKLHNSLIVDAFVDDFNMNKFQWFCLVVIMFSFEHLYMHTMIPKIVYIYSKYCQHSISPPIQEMFNMDVFLREEFNQTSIFESLHGKHSKITGLQKLWLKVAHLPCPPVQTCLKSEM